MKHISRVIAVVGLASMLVACGQKPAEPKKAETASSTVQTTTTKGAEAPVKLVLKK